MAASYPVPYVSREDRSQMMSVVSAILSDLEGENVSISERQTADGHVVRFECGYRVLHVDCDERGYTLHKSDFQFTVRDLQFLALFMLHVGASDLPHAWGVSY